MVLLYPIESNLQSVPKVSERQTNFPGIKQYVVLCCMKGRRVR